MRWRVTGFLDNTLMFVPSLRHLAVGLLLGVACCVICDVEAATFHVSPSGSNTPPYSTSAQAAQHPSSANALATGYSDTVLLHAGDYLVSTSIEVAVGVTWVGDDSSSVLLRWIGSSQPPIWIVRGAGDNLFRGICFLNPNPAGQMSLAGLISSNDDNLVLTVEHCWFSACELGVGGLDSAEIHDNRFDVWLGNGINFGVSSASKFHIYRNRFVSGPAGSGAGMAIDAGAGNVIIEDNVFDYRPSQGRGHGIYVDRYPTSAIVRNNLIMGSHWPLNWDGVQGVVENNTFWAGREMLFWLELSDTLVFRNNIVCGLTERIYPHNPCSPCLVFVHNAFWPPEDSIYDPHPGQIDPADTANFSAYPMFEDDSLFRLQEGSPLIDMGDPSLLDLDGTRSDIGWTGGPGGISYDYQQLPPLPPDSIDVVGSNGIVSITWLSRPESDLAEYRLYRGTTSGFWMPGLPPHRVLSPSNTTMLDTLLLASESYFYVVTAVDTAGLESVTSPEGEYIVSGVFDDEDEESLVPESFAIRRAYPNPFNSSTTIEIEGIDGQSPDGDLALELCDVLGRAVVSLPGNEVSVSRPWIEWNGQTGAGRSCPSGVYFARLTFRGVPQGQTVKLVLLR